MAVVYRHVLFPISAAPIHGDHRLVLRSAADAPRVHRTRQQSKYE
jgi:hypothetical protein